MTIRYSKLETAVSFTAGLGGFAAWILAAFLTKIHFSAGFVWRHISLEPLQAFIGLGLSLMLLVAVITWFVAKRYDKENKESE